MFVPSEPWTGLPAYVLPNHPKLPRFNRQVYQQISGGVPQRCVRSAWVSTPLYQNSPFVQSTHAFEPDSGGLTGSMDTRLKHRVCKTSARSLAQVTALLLPVPPGPECAAERKQA